MSGFDISKESWNTAVRVAKGMWVIATHHHPGGSRFSPHVNNRCLVFLLNDALDGGREVLLVANATDGVALQPIRKLSEETGAPIRFLIAAGAGHSLHLAEWHDALPETQVLVGPTRIPRIAAGRKLARSPRFKVFDGDDPLPMFHGQLEAVNFDSLGGFRETVTPKEGGKDSRWGMLGVMLRNMPPKDPHDELWLYHVASRTAIGGENLGWRLSQADRVAMAWMLRMMMKAEVTYIVSGPRPPLDKDRVRRHWEKILAWPADNLLSYHDTLGTGEIGNARAKLRHAVEAVHQI